MVLAALWACTPDPIPSADPFEGQATLHIDQGEAGTLDESFGHVGVSEAEGDGYRVWATSGLDREYTLIVVLDQVGPAQVHLRHGEQMIAGDGSTCTAALGVGDDQDQGETLDLQCVGMQDEGGALFDLDAQLSGGTTTEDSREAWLTAEGWSAVPRSVDGDVLAPEWAVVLPWRGGERWALTDTAGHGGRRDLELRMVFEEDGVELGRYTREAAAGALELHVLADAEVTAGVDGVTESATGTDLVVPLWEDLQAGPDDLFVKIQ